MGLLALFWPGAKMERERMARAAKRWLTYLEDERGLAPDTIKTYKSALTTFINLLPPVYTDRDLLEAINVRMGPEASAHVAYTTDTTLRQFYDWWEDFGGIPNPLQRRQKIPKPDSRRHGMTKEEQGLFLSRLAVASLKNKAVCWLMLTQGFRIGDVAKIKVEHIKFDAGLIRAALGKRRTDRWLPLSEQAATSLRAWLTFTRIESGWVFPGAQGRLGMEAAGHMHPQTVWKIWKTVCGEELDYLTPHQARHTYGTLLTRGHPQELFTADGERVIVRMRPDMQTAKYLMRHKKMQQTEEYVDDDDEEQRDAIVHLSSYFKKLTPGGTE